ncbi:MAG: polysaccharide deacetylase family protein, partial [bacterium]
FVNLPLGYLKAYSDDLILRTFLRSFLFKIISIPHLANTPSAKGGIIINWHIDANSDWISIPNMIKNKYLKENLEFSNHITAGEFRDTPGDNLGFDACGKGKKYVEMILKYGEIGSHGGWAHNYFSYGILDGKINQQQIEYYILKNNQCLQSITGKEIKEYSAPNGVHPQPIKTQILEKLGIIAYYYTGDTGSSPNRTFFDGKMVSKNVIAFPICNYKESASLFEMYKNKKSEEEVEKFLLDLLDYTKNERVVRLFYSHPYDIPHYPYAIKNFINKAEKLQENGYIKVKSMKYFAEFLLRFLQTKYTFKIKNNILEAEVHNPLGLQEITLAIPKNYTIISNTISIETDSDENYNYYIIKENITLFRAKFKNISN